MKGREGKGRGEERRMRRMIKGEMREWGRKEKEVVVCMGIVTAPLQEQQEK